MKDFPVAKDSLEESIKHFETILPKKTSTKNSVIDHITILLDDTEKSTTALHYATLLGKKLQIELDAKLLLVPTLQTLMDSEKKNQLKSKIIDTIVKFSQIKLDLSIIEDDPVNYFEQFNIDGKQSLLIIPTPYFEDREGDTIETLGAVTDIALSILKSPILIIQKDESKIPNKILKTTIIVYDLELLGDLYHDTINLFPDTQLQILCVDLSRPLLNAGYIHTDEIEISEYEEESRILLSSIEKDASKNNRTCTYKVVKNDIFSSLDQEIEAFEPNLLVMGIVDDKDDIKNQFKISYLRKGRISHGILVLHYNSDDENHK